MQPFFSIVVPIYNVERFLPTCIESILAQTLDDFELILVNDGSTDSCSQICRSFQKADSRIVYLSQENKGLLLARRYGLKHVCGKYVVHIDSDDACKPELLEELYKAIQETDADLLVYSYDLIDLYGKVIKINTPVFPGEEIIDFKNNKELFIKETLKNHALNSIWIKCAKREIIDIDVDYSSYGRLMMGEDILQSAALYENASKIVYIGKDLYLYRVNPNGMSRTIKKEYLFHYLAVRSRLYEMIERLSLGDETRQLFYRYYVHYFANYVFKLSLLCNKDEYYSLMKKSKEKFIPVRLETLKESASIIDRLAFSVSIGKNYWLVKMIARLYFH